MTDTNAVPRSSSDIYCVEFGQAAMDSLEIAPDEVGSSARTFRLAVANRSEQCKIRWAEWVL